MPQNKKKIVLGLTGSFGSGKTTVARIFASFGAAIVDADKIAHSLFKPGSRVYRKIIRVFGRGILKKDRTIDRAKLGKIVFSDNGRPLAKLNAVTHPKIIRIIKSKINKSTEKIIVLDAPLLIEAGLAGIVDKLIVVNIGLNEQIKRIGKRTKLGSHEILTRIRRQIPLQKKMRLADFIIDNSSTFGKTKEQAVKVWEIVTGECLTKEKWRE